MGLFGLLKKQFINVIEWTESTDGVLAYRYPMNDKEIQNGAQLTVRESQAALFVNEGNVADLFGPGLHTLNTKNLPIMTTLQNWDKLFQSPFKSDVYFFSLRDQTNQKWGTPQPVTVRDKDYGPLRLRANGSYSYKIKNPQTFYKKISGSREIYTTQDIEGQLRGVILTNLSSFFGNGSIPFLDMAANQNKFSETLKSELAPSFAEYGLDLQSFYVQSISLPEEVQAHLDKMSEMRMVGDIQKYAQFQSADSISIAAANPGGAAGAGIGMATGLAMGQNMASSLGSGGPVGATASDDAVATINKLHELMTKGVLSKEEFEAKKAELLKKIT